MEKNVFRHNTNNIPTIFKAAFRILILSANVCSMKNVAVFNSKHLEKISSVFYSILLCNSSPMFFSFAPFVGCIVPFNVFKPLDLPLKLAFFASFFLKTISYY